VCVLCVCVVCVCGVCVCGVCVCVVCVVCVCVCVCDLETLTMRRWKSELDCSATEKQTQMIYFLQVLQQFFTKPFEVMK